MSAHLKQLQTNGVGAPSGISGADAGKLIAASAHEAYDVVGFNEAEATRLNVQHGEVVAIAPEDSGQYPHPIPVFCKSETNGT